MGWIIIYVQLVKLTFFVHLKMHLLVFLICLYVLVSLHLHLFNINCISCVIDLSTFVK
jgi:hypothetical protein